jgi:integrase
VRAYRRTGDKTYTLKIKARTGAWRERSCGTRDKHTARAIERMVDDLGHAEARAWDVLDRVVHGQLTLSHLLDLYRSARQDVVTLRALLQDVDVSPLVEEWAQSLRRKSRGVSKDTATRYPGVVRTRIPADEVVLRSSLVPHVVAGWVLDTDASAGTVRRHAAAFRSFFGWLQSRGVLITDPLAGVRLPSAGKPRDRALTTAEVLAFADTCEEPLRTLELLLAATAADLSTACALVRSDIDLQAMTVRLRGTKTHARDRVQVIASFAHDAIRSHCRTLMPSARLFPFDRWQASDRHRVAVLEAIERYPWIAGYQLRDHRHTWAVRMARAGAPMRVIADGLGHANEALASRVYARYQPTAVERQEWERRAADRDHREASG